MPNTMRQTVIAPALTADEAADFQACEVTINEGLSTYVDVGVALVRIRENKYYRDKHDSWEAYCRERWQMSARHALETIATAIVFINVTSVNLPGPHTAQHAALLAQLPPGQQAEVWKVASSEGPPTIPTLRQEIKRVVNIAKPGPSRKSKKPADPRPSKPKPEPAPIKAEPVRDAVGNVITDTLLAALFSRRHEFKTIMEQVRDLQQAVSQFAESTKEDLSVYFNRQSVDVAFDGIWDAMKFAIPHALCPYCKGKGKCHRCRNTGWMPRKIYDQVPPHERWLK